MKTIRILMIGLFVTLLTLGWRAMPSLAVEEHGAEDIQMLRDAATALQTSNPELAEKLNKYADQESVEIGEGEAEEAGEAVDNGEKEETDEV